VGRFRPRRLRALALLVLAVVAGCTSRSDPTSGSPVGPNEPTLELVFTYGSEKQAWIDESVGAFNASRQKLPDGKIIQVKAFAMGSGECIDEILAGTRQPHLTSPASAAFIKLGNAQSKVRTGKDLVGPTQNLVLSPVVIAMWQPMAEALARDGKRVGWADIVDLARNPAGWASRGHPEWRAFRFGHTHPGASNSGLSALLAEAYAANAKVAGLTLADLARPETAQFVGGVEQAVVHYGSSTGFFGRKMFSEGPSYLSAAVLYENMVIEAHDPKYQLAFPVVAVYPREGTFWSDHPVGVVQRDWVTPAHKQAADLFIAFLLDKTRQQRAMALGFRPADPSLALAAPIDAAHGVNPREPQTTLDVPDPAVLQGALDLFTKVKKHARVVLAVDVSGSMQEDNKFGAARDGAAAFVEALGDADAVSLVTFNNQVTWATHMAPVAQSRAQVLGVVRGLFADGGTSLYDAVGEGYDMLQRTPAAAKISAIVVLSDGADRNSTTSLSGLLQKVRPNNESGVVRIFTIGYGKDASADQLRQIAEATQGRYYEGKPSNIREVFKDISTFF
jgi:Ca-activated chloride channel family protein